MCSEHIGMCEFVRIAERQIDMRLSRKMHDSIDVVLLQTVHYIFMFGYIAFVEGEIGFLIQLCRIVESGAIIQFIE